MKRELLILRHGKSDWTTGVADHERPLKDRGKRDAQRMGVWLARHELQPDCVLASTAERALTTAHKCIKSMGSGTQAIVADDRLYGAGIRDVCAVLAECAPDTRRVMVVGHNPTLEEFVEWLAQGPLEIPEDGKLLPTATLARLRVNADWQHLDAGGAELIEIIRPGSLPRKFPFPSPHGTEERDRPAYYYRQSAVIPYRVNGKGVQILIIKSSKVNHWVVPKGIWEPGLSARESAAQEAFEEAGASGVVGDEMLGSYSTPKWGAECTVDVYAMQVADVVDDEAWEESHRGRRWVPAKEAAKLLRQPELAPMVLKLAKHVNKGK